jgi:hypothetical protein
VYLARFPDFDHTRTDAGGFDMNARATPLLLLILALSAPAAPAQSQDGPPPNGAPPMRMHGPGSGTPPDPVVLKGPPAPGEFVRLVQLQDDKAGRYKELYDRFMAETKPQRDSLAGLRRDATGGLERGDRDSLQRLREVFMPLRQDLERRQAAFDDTLHDLLDKDQWKRYQNWREEERKVAEQQRRERWRQHRSGAAADGQPPG